MITFNPSKLLLKQKKERNLSFKLATPKEIRERINTLSKCPKCHFVVFDNYWSDDTHDSLKKNICSTCGFEI